MAHNKCLNCGRLPGSHKFCPACQERAEKEITVCVCGAPATERQSVGRVIHGAGDRRPVEYRERYEMMCRACADEA